MDKRVTYFQFLSPNDIKCARFEHIRVDVVTAQISNEFIQTAPVNS